jgi:asparagine synthase (glutamine-hydrolysing)
MCGIAGVIDFNKASSEAEVNDMIDTLQHRGPDGGAVFMEQLEHTQIGLGHRRLSIIDLSNGGAQPMHLQHLSIVFNGEIYNYKEIKDSLIKKGHVFTSSSDTEVLLHAYLEWGKNAIEKLIGMFAFVLIDKKLDEAFIVRDRAGVKPLFWYFNNGLFLFASELKALVAHSAFKKDLNLNAAAAYFKTGYIPAPQCIYKNTQKLQPGHYLTLNFKNQGVSISQYWSVYTHYNKPPLDISFDEAKQETEKIIKSACDYRMVADVPVGVFLSGGYDSSLITALLQKDSTKKIKTFTIGVPDAGLNEAPFAKQIAKHLGTEHNEYYCTQKEALDIVPNLPYYYDEPFADSSAIPTTLVSKMARQQVTVALSADAGDEIFAGYNRYDYLLKYGGKIKALPKPLAKFIANVMHAVPAKNIPVLNKKYLFPQRYEKVKSFLNNPTDKNILASITNLFTEAELQQLFNTDIIYAATAFDKQDLEAPFYNTLHYMMAMDYETYLPDDILQKVDRATMSVSLEGREPLLDQRVVEWAAQLPQQYKYNNGNKKYILKEIVHQYIPKEIMERPKMGFGIPIADWLAGDLKPYVQEYLSEQFLNQQQLFNVSMVTKMVNAFFNGKQERAEKIWYLLMFQMWYKKWM